MKHIDMKTQVSLKKGTVTKLISASAKILDSRKNAIYRARNLFPLNSLLQQISAKCKYDLRDLLRGRSDQLVNQQLSFF